MWSSLLFSSNSAKTWFAEGQDQDKPFEIFLPIKYFMLNTNNLFQIQEKRATAHPSTVSELSNVVDGPKVVIDSNLITSMGLSTVSDFALAIVSKFFGHARARSVAEGLVFEYPRN